MQNGAYSWVGPPAALSQKSWPPGYQASLTNLFLKKNPLHFGTGISQLAAASSYLEKMSSLGAAEHHHKCPHPDAKDKPYPCDLCHKYLTICNTLRDQQQPRPSHGGGPGGAPPPGVGGGGGPPPLGAASALGAERKGGGPLLGSSASAQQPPPGQQQQQQQQQQQGAAALTPASLLERTNGHGHHHHHGAHHGAAAAAGGHGAFASLASTSAQQQQPGSSSSPKPHTGGDKSPARGSGPPTPLSPDLRRGPSEDTSPGPPGGPDPPRPFYSAPPTPAPPPPHSPRWLVHPRHYDGGFQAPPYPSSLHHPPLASRLALLGAGSPQHQPHSGAASPDDKAPSQHLGSAGNPSGGDSFHSPANPDFSQLLE
ncbi:hypothetical protein HPB52_020047 [Rhipicephalus sanguineus]|uniref:Uncharacterized protein n=1 Tax=Rhipicephalus sanguineus TaxID=34632 RepID=A0A9D4PXK8_RHISA|nr:hypothetical protein HPB52_020047 [Rhipicephalus sanguineus]